MIFHASQTIENAFRSNVSKNFYGLYIVMALFHLFVLLLVSLFFVV